MSLPEIHKVLVLSTGHVSEEVVQAFNNQEVGRLPIYYELGGTGWFVWAEDPVWSKSSFPELDQVLSYALSLGCSWVRFDRDGDVYPDLPFFYW